MLSNSNKILCNKDELRTTFTLAMSAMYRKEVPLYGDLIRIVNDVNQQMISSVTDSNSIQMRNGDVAPERLQLERHGAIRLGTPYELATIRRFFAQIGLYPVGYYDLSVAGLPMHATAFRPITAEALSQNPFRIFTTLLRPELLTPEARELGLRLLNQRNIFSDRLLQLLDTAEASGGLTEGQGKELVTEALNTFRWQSVAAATYGDYQHLKAEHPILADICCFNSAHINHLTPRTLDIAAAQEQMKHEGLSVKSRIEGPPPRLYPVLLRQTSFLALEERIQFRSHEGGLSLDGQLVDGYHTARFGEIEQRGAAVTPRGRALYDTLLDRAMRRARESASGPAEMDSILQETFQEFPDDWNTLVEQDLVFRVYESSSKANKNSRPEPSTMKLSELSAASVLQASPITYEDFLPFSAAGIFQSNLRSAPFAQIVSGTVAWNGGEDREGLERALGCQVYEPDDLYRSIQKQSLVQCATELGLKEII